MSNQPISHNSINSTNSSLDRVNNNLSFFSSIKILRHATATPITNLLINLDLLFQDPGLTESQSNCSHYLKQAFLSAKYLQNIMNQCEQKQVNNQQFKIKDTLMELIELCKKPQLKGHLIHFLQLNGTEILQGNKLYFQEAIICLLNNAFQAYSEYAANKLVVLFSHIEDEVLKIKVVDGASGLLQLNDIGSKSIELKSSDVPQKGTGLQFVEQVITQHFGGNVTVKTTLNKGTTVHCSLPVFSEK